jgi:hypothetical protein
MKMKLGLFAVLALLTLASAAFGYQRQVLLEVLTSST